MHSVATEWEAVDQTVEWVSGSRKIQVQQQVMTEEREHGHCYGGGPMFQQIVLSDGGGLQDWQSEEQPAVE